MSLYASNFSGTRRLLLASSIMAFPFTLIIFHFFPAEWPPIFAFIAALFFYWVFILGSALAVTKFRLEILKNSLKPRNKPGWIVSYNIFAFTPVAGVFFVTFLPNVSELSFINLMIIILISLINGTLEEIFWRGLYLIHFRHNTKIAIIFSSIVFGLWHLSLLSLKGIQYKGGFITLVGGALFMGFVWSFIAQKTGSIFYTITAHIAVNIFAFTGLFVGNNF